MQGNASGALHAKKELLEGIKTELEEIKPMKAVFDKNFVKKLDGKYVKSENTHRDKIEALRNDIKKFRKENNLERVVMIWCGSTETYQDPSDKISTFIMTPLLDFLN